MVDFQAHNEGTISSQDDVEEYINCFERWYEEVQLRFEPELIHKTQLRHLCDRLQNQTLPIYSWYNLKESFSARFPTWLVEYLEQQYEFTPEHVLDPFVGVGTTTLSLSMRGIPAVGIEYNPFIAWVARAKTHWQDYHTDQITHSIENITFELPTRLELDWPELSTFHNEKYFRADDVNTLLHVISQVQDLDVSKLTKQFLMLAVASAVETVSNLRKDGRGLRYVQREDILDASDVISSRWKQALNEVTALQNELKKQPDPDIGETTILEGSAVDLSKLRNSEGSVSLADEEFDLVVYSPPYLNNFDYSEIYKLELWLLRFITDYGEWRDLRRGTLRSHHSIKFEETSYLANDPATSYISDQLVKMVESPCLDGYARDNMPPVIHGYFDDMYRALREQYRVLRPGGFLAYLVGNSRHSRLPIATDLLIGEIARSIGFVPVKLLVLNKRNGRTRSNEFLRESVVILRKS